MSGAAARTKFLMNMASVQYLKYKKIDAYNNNTRNNKGVKKVMYRKYRCDKDI